MRRVGRLHPDDKRWMTLDYHSPAPGPLSRAYDDLSLDTPSGQ